MKNVPSSLTIFILLLTLSGINTSENPTPDNFAEVPTTTERFFEDSSLVDTYLGDASPPKSFYIMATEISSRSARFVWNRELPSTNPMYVLCGPDSCTNITNSNSSLRDSVKVEDLEPWTNYTLTVSDTGIPVHDRMRIHFHTDVEAPEGEIEVTGKKSWLSDVAYYDWGPPAKPNGPLNGFEIKICQRNLVCGFSDTTPEMRQSCNESIVVASAHWNSYAQRLQNNVSSVIFSIRAFNNKNGSYDGKLFGPSTTARCLNFQTPDKTNNTVYAGSNWIKVECDQALGNFPARQFSVTLCKENGTSCIVEVVSNRSSIAVFEGLQPYSTYEITASGFHIKDDGETMFQTPAVDTVRTGVGEPEGEMSVTLSWNSPTGLYVQWNKPAQPNGPIDGFIVKWCIRDTFCSDDSKEPTYRDCTNTTTILPEIHITAPKRWESIDIFVQAYNLDSDTDSVIEGNTSQLQCLVVNPPNGLSSTFSIGGDEEATKYLEYVLKHQNITLLPFGQNTITGSIKHV